MISGLMSMILPGKNKSPSKTKKSSTEQKDTDNAATASSTSETKNDGAADDGIDDEDLFSSSDDEDEEIIQQRLAKEREEELAANGRPIYLSDQIASLYGSDRLSDIIFVVGKNDKIKRFHSHRFLLATSSPMLESMIYPPLPTTNNNNTNNNTTNNNNNNNNSNNNNNNSNNNTNESNNSSDSSLSPPPQFIDERHPLLVMIPDEDPTMFDLLLCSIYMDFLPQGLLNSSTLPSLLSLSRKYGVEKLTAQCANFMEKSLKITTALPLFTSAINLLNEMEFGRAFIEENISDIVRSRSFYHLDAERIRTILSWNNLAIEEYVLFHALCKWGEYQKKKKEGKINETLEKKLLEYERENGIDNDNDDEEIDGGSASSSSSSSYAPSFGALRGGRGGIARGGRGGRGGGRGGFAAPSSPAVVKKSKKASKKDSDKKSSSLSKSESSSDDLDDKKIATILKNERFDADKLKGSDYSSIKEYIGDLLSLIRLPLLSIEELSVHIQPSKLVSKQDLLTLFRYQALPSEKEKENLRKSVPFPFIWRPRSGASFARDSKIIKSNHRKIMDKFFIDSSTKKKKTYRMEILYRGSKDGYTASAFHDKCDGKGATLTIIRNTAGYIFGGFNGESWSMAGSYINHNSFLFSLGLAHQTAPSSWLPVKLTTTGSGAYNGSGYGPTFGGGHDLHVNNAMKSTSNYCSPSNYMTIDPQFSSYHTAVTSNTLAGSYNWTVDEIEVYACKEKSSSS